MAGREVLAAVVQVPNVMERILGAVRTDQSVDTLGLEENLESLEIPKELSKNPVVNPESPHPFWSTQSHPVVGQAE